MSLSVVLEKLPNDPTGTFASHSKLKRQRVYIFPTSQGWVYSLMLVVMLFGAINYNNSMAYILCFLLSGLGLISMLHTYKNLTGIIIHSRKPEPVFAGEKALFPLLVDNRSGLKRLSLNINERKKKKFGLNTSNSSSGIRVNIPEAKQKRIYFPQQTGQRGLLKASRIVIHSEYPIGLFRAWSYFESEEECLVYPLPEGKDQMPMMILENEEAEVGQQHGLDDFSGFRKYHPGDAINSIAWKAYAREQGLLVKQFSGKGNKIYMFNWESVSHIDDLENKLSQLCYWIILADRDGLQYGLRIPGTEISPGFGIGHKENCLEALARYGNE